MRAFGDNNNKGFIVPIQQLCTLAWFDYRPLSAIAQSDLWTF